MLELRRLLLPPMYVKTTCCKLSFIASLVSELESRPFAELRTVASPTAIHLRINHAIQVQGPFAMRWVEFLSLTPLFGSAAFRAADKP